MSENVLQKLFADIKKLLGTLDFPRKMAALAIALAIVLGIFVITVWVSRTEYKALYTELNGEDSSQIARILEQKKNTLSGRRKGHSDKSSGRSSSYLEIRVSQNGDAIYRDSGL